jgi:hypothetical protein
LHYVSLRFGYLPIDEGENEAGFVSSFLSESSPAVPYLFSENRQFAIISVVIDLPEDQHLPIDSAPNQTAGLGKQP